MKFTVLIPARLASTRLPRKPLADIAGIPMVVRVARRAMLSSAREVIVAADDAEIVAACAAHSVRALATRADHPSGSDRLAEACTALGLGSDEIVVNVQGDEPLIDPSLIDACAERLRARSDCAMSTAAHPVTDPAEFTNPNVVKLVCDSRGDAIYFSRAPIPWWRDGYGGGVTHLADPPPLRHIGIYAYRARFLRRYPTLAASPLEALESLEQLRAIWHGERIAVHVTSQRPEIGVDTAEDLERVRATFG